MKVKKINQSQLATRMGVDKSRISEYMKDGCASMRVVERIAYGLECSPRGLIVEEER